MKEIKIFIDSSVDKNEFELEREKLGSFINGLNRKYIKQGIFIDLYDCETVSNQMRAEGSQKQHDDYIENEADATFFMFFKKAGEFTLHELQIARDALVNQKRPDIFTYFKVVGDDIEQTDQIKKAVDIIANSYGHYFSKFTDVDTIKLGMLQYIADKLNDGSSVTIYDGEFYVNDTKIDGIELDNIFAYQNNSEYKRLKEKLSELDDKINEAIKNKQFKDIETFTQQKETAEKVFAKLESDILNMIINMQKEMQKGNINPVRMQAYQLLEMGKIKEAQKLIPIGILKARSENLLLKNQIQQQDNKDLVENAKVRIETLKLDVSNSDRFNMMADTYESIIENAFLCYDDVFIYDYCSFLDKQNNSPKAYEVGKKLEGLYLLNENKFEKSDFASLYNLLGIICGNLSLHKKQENYFKKSITINEQLVKIDLIGFDTYKANLACDYDIAGCFYDTQGNTEQALYYLVRAIKIREQLAKENPKKYNQNLATSYNNAGVCYKNQGDFKHAEHYYTKAIDIDERLSEENPKKYNQNLATSYNNAGNFYSDHGNIKQAEFYYIKAIEIREKLAKDNPERYNADLADSYNNAGNFYYKQGNNQVANYYYSKALVLFEQFAEKSCLAIIYNNLAVFYKEQGKTIKAEHYLIKAIEIREQLAKDNPEKYNSGLATSYNNAGNFYSAQDDVKKAECYYIKVIKIRKQLVKYNPERYNADLADSYYSYGFFTDNEEYFDKALTLAKTQPDNPYCRRIISTLEN